MSILRQHQLHDISRDPNPDAAECAQHDLALEYPTQPERIYPEPPAYADPDNAGCPGVFVPPDLAGLVGTPPHGRVVAIDTETYYDAEYSVSKMGYHAYTHDRRFHAYAVAFMPIVDDAVNKANGAAYVDDLAAVPWAAWVTPTTLLVAHNATFDRHIFERLQEQGVIPAHIKPAGWLCTAALSRYLHCPGDLAGSAKAILGIELSKAERTAAKGRKRDKGLFVDAAEREYVLADASACAGIWMKAAQFWPEHERVLWRLTEAMGDAGVSLDCDKAEALVKYCLEQRLAAEGRIPWVLAGRKPLSTKALKDECARLHVEHPPSTEDGDPALAAWSKTWEATPAPGWVEAMQDMRRWNRKALIVQSMLARTKIDGRMEAHIMYHGAVTGRWSGGGHGLNMQSLNTATDEGDMRGLLVPERGHSFVIADLSQIEARILLWMVGDAATLELIRGGMDLYEAHARATMGYSDPRPLKAVDNDLRKLAKARVLGAGYGCGAEKFVLIAKTMAGLDVSLDVAKQTVNAYRKSNPGIPALWRRLESDFSACDGKTYSQPLPSGRFLRYRNVNASDMTAEQEKGTRDSIWGGILCENLVSGAARDLFADRLLALVAAGLRPVMLIHDEYVLEVPGGEADAALRLATDLICTPPAWAAGLPVGVEARLAMLYGK